MAKKPKTVGFWVNGEGFIKLVNDLKSIEWGAFDTLKRGIPMRVEPAFLGDDQRAWIVLDREYYEQLARNYAVRQLEDRYTEES